MTAPGAVLPLRTFMQRLVLLAWTKKLPVCASAEIVQLCCAEPPPQHIQVLCEQRRGV